MSTFTRASLGTTAIGLALTAVAAAPQLGSAAPAGAVTHTLKLVAHQTASHSAGKTGFLGADTDRSPKTHEVVGYDSITGHFNVKTHRVKIDAAVALKGGLLTAHLTGSGDTNTFDGTITGGTGKYAGAQGTVQTHGKGKRTVITFEYHF
jgi:hypothetical protein